MIDLYGHTTDGSCYDCDTDAYRTRAELTKVVTHTDKSASPELSELFINYQLLVTTLASFSLRKKSILVNPYPLLFPSQ